MSEVRLYRGVTGVEYVGNNCSKVSYKGCVFYDDALDDFLFGQFQRELDTDMTELEGMREFRRWVANNNQWVYDLLDTLISIKKEFIGE